MSNGRLRPGSVITYPYLWRWQSDRGETAGRKDRPVCVAIAVSSADALTHLALLPISSRPPEAEQAALEIPAIERKRGGLSDFRRAWITVGEYNYDIAERSFYLEIGDPAVGRFGRAFTRKSPRQWQLRSAKGKVASIARGDARRRCGRCGSGTLLARQ